MKYRQVINDNLQDSLIKSILQFSETVLEVYKPNFPKKIPSVSILLMAVESAG